MDLCRSRPTCLPHRRARPAWPPALVRRRPGAGPATPRIAILRTACWSSRPGWSRPWARRRRCCRRCRRAPIVDHHPHLLMPGLIDTHIHLPQTQVIASYGAQLMEWLKKYTFVEEQKFRPPGPCRAAVARSSSTSCCATAPPRPRSTARCIRNRPRRFFAESQRRNTRMIAGKVMMDRNAPDGADRHAPRRGYRDSKALIARWHGKGRQLYAITPRFALTSTPAQLEAARRLGARASRLPTSRPISTRTGTRSPSPASSIRRPRTTPTSTSATACSGRASCSATAST